MIEGYVNEALEPVVEIVGRSKVQGPEASGKHAAGSG